MAVLKLLLPLLFLSLASLLLLNSFLVDVVEATSWCLARIDATNQALQTALDYACQNGADCSPIEFSNGLCFLPNTIQAHASYAFNSYYQRKAMAPGSCDFAGSATIAKTDPSYGSCIYPSSQSAAGGIPTPTTTATNNPNVPTTIPINGDGGTGLNNPGLNPPISTTDGSKASFDCIVAEGAMSIVLILLVSFVLHPIWIF